MNKCNINVPKIYKNFIRLLLLLSYVLIKKFTKNITRFFKLMKNLF